MNTLTLKKATTRLEHAIRKASRVLLEFEVKQSEWEISHKKGKIYKSANELMGRIKTALA